MRRHIAPGARVTRPRDVASTRCASAAPSRSSCRRRFRCLTSQKAGKSSDAMYAVLDHVEPGFEPPCRASSPRRVTPLVPEKAVVVVVASPGLGRYHDDGTGTRPQHPPDLGERSPVVRQVLEQVRADDGVGAGVLERQVTRVRLQQSRARDESVSRPQPGGNEVDADQHCLGMRRPQVVEQVPGRAADVDEHRASRQVADPLDDHIARPHVDEMRAAGLLVQTLELVGPVDRRRLRITEERSPLAPVTSDQPAGVEAGTRRPCRVAPRSTSRIASRHGRS